MSRRLLTPTGQIDITDADPQLVNIIASLSTELANEKAHRRRTASDARKYERRLTATQADLDALREEVDGSDVGELKKQLRAETRRANRLAKKVDALTTDRRERTAERKNLMDRITDLQKSNDKYRQRLDGMKVDLERARQGAHSATSRSAMTDLQIATVMLNDLNDRLATQARQTTSAAAATGLRLAAREVVRIRQQLSERNHLAAAS